ncbi:HEAT repeat domain-containing protein [Enhygromyxa salina]|uniref:HEAT repeat protein n=1 Tax=Enhygromyxa salina TaxID=215803 RepID=A0A2S9XZ36_9BACT|nr:HEAT repeat domain-containing protein [Enhygromyxa salina]PRP98106.1 HEAT repeat protein [Enhygromyxa salina]
MKARLPALIIATLPALASEAAAADVPDGRYPVWPTEIDRIAQPLRDPTIMSESARIAALEELDAYASEVILPDLELALTDPSPEVRKIALQLCASRHLLACVDEAEQMWETGEGSVRLLALQLLSQDPTPAHLDLVYEAMRDPNDLIREQAIMLLVDAPLGPERAVEARRELVAQLGDISARVRRTAARSLGRMGPGEGALALVRLLDDIDADVATAAAVSLGQMADARTAPALRRTLDNPANPVFGSAAVTALARLPGREIDLQLLDLLDAPPRNIRRPDVAKAIGGRPDPDPELIAGLVDRMRDPELREPSTQALLWLGDRAVAQLASATERGLEPDIALEVQRLLAARRLEPTPRVATSGDSPVVESTPLELPAIDDRKAWFDRLGDPEAELIGAALAEAAPAWMGGALAWQLDRAASAEQVRPWLMALALAPEPILDDPAHAVIWGRVAGWAHDRSNSGDSRCLATLGLGRAEGTRHAEPARVELRQLAAAHHADVRACAALALARFGEDPLLEALLADPSPRVRAATALSLRIIRRPAAVVRARLSLQADRDSEMRARTSAALSLQSRDPEARFVLVRARPSSASGWAGSDLWERFVFGEVEVDVPMFGSGRGWAIVPLPGAVPAVVDTGAVLLPINDYAPHDYYHM